MLKIKTFKSSKWEAKGFFTRETSQNYQLIFLAETLRLEESGMI